MSDASIHRHSDWLSSPADSVKSFDHLAKQRAVGRFFADVCIWFIAVVSAMVMFEPAPYELLIIGLLPLLIIFGLKITANSMPLIILGSLYALGGLIATFTTHNPSGSFIYVTTTLFMWLSAWFFALVITASSHRLKVVFGGYLVAAIFASLLGILGYLDLIPNAQLFTLYDRAKGSFKDPNVFGPFLLLPFCWLWLNILTKRDNATLFRIAGAGVLLLALLLSFSRAAWAATIFCSGMIFAISWLYNRDATFRLRQILIAVLGAFTAVIAFTIAMQFDAIADLFFVRAQLVHEYDIAELGRFQRHWIGFGWALSEPLGIGVDTFGARFGEEAHNIWLKSLLTYGWLGFASFAVLVAFTLAKGFGLLFLKRPWTPYVQVLYVVFIAHILIGWIIDINHWRHFYLILGLLWGIYGLESRYQRQIQLSS